MLLRARLIEIIFSGLDEAQMVIELVPLQNPVSRQYFGLCRVKSSIK